jgi:hypothetical protein
MPYIEMLIASILNNLGHATTQVFKMNETFVQGYCNDIKKIHKNPIQINYSIKNGFLIVFTTF